MTGKNCPDNWKQSKYIPTQLRGCGRSKNLGGGGTTNTSISVLFPISAKSGRAMPPPPPLIPAPLILYQRYNQQTVSCIATTSILVYSEVWSLVRVALEEAYSHQIGKLATIQSPNFFKGVSFHVSFHVKFGNMRCCDFNINNPQNSCLDTWLSTWNITFWVKYSIKKIGECRRANLLHRVIIDFYQTVYIIKQVLVHYVGIQQYWYTDYVRVS